MKHRKRKEMNLIIYIICLGIFSLLHPLTSYAEESQSDPLDSGTFTYKVILPENQASEAGYFDLRMTPGQQQVVQIELNNPSEQTAVTVGVSLSGAKTNANGVLEYGPAAIEKDASLRYDFETIVTGPETVTLAPGETKMLELAIAMPEEHFDGYIAGGIQLEVVLTEETKKARESQTGIINDYAFLVGMLLSESDSVVEPEITFNRIYVDLANYRNAFFVNFSNTEMGFMSGMTVDFQVMKKGSDEILYDTKKADMRMAPNSMIDFPLTMNGDEMVPGTYTGHVLVTSGERKWEWTQDFEITDEEAEKYNKQDVSLVQERGINWLLIAGIVVGVLLVLILLFVLVHGLNKRHKQKQRKARKQLKKKAGKDS
ncbi:DUF916 and DUF3324 domain-containing protein [Enterococcus sp. BWR-S5]|uniref:DUF916 and DUF3324 domain-containing protein n=1 Tax=Enterococcus sp. BWR-S5 TaxID=2787714 RepID=UPI001F19573E|nr:DUF916 and DUF3324 domain-containing protein [Enterococcus sp. BWR-S5]